MENVATAYSIADEYEIDTGNLVGVNDFSMGHEAGQAFAAERIAILIRDNDAGSKAFAMLKELRGMFPDDPETVADTETAELLAEIDGYLADNTQTVD